MSMYELDTGWASTEAERRGLPWELLACEELYGVFLTSRENVLAVRLRLSCPLPRSASGWLSDSPPLQTNEKGASQ